MSEQPLLSRDPGDILFRGPAGAVTVAAFLRQVARTAAGFAGMLPAGTPLLNLCRDRDGFALAFAAAAVGGYPTLLGSDRSPERLAAVALSHPTVHAVRDDPATETGALPTVELPALELDAVASCDWPIPALTLPHDRLVAKVSTSGSTGEPTDHAKRWGALVRRSLAAAHRFRIGEAGPASLVGTVGPQHMYGLETTILLPFHAAASVWTGPAFFPEDIRAALAAMPAPRLLFTTPLQLRALLESETALPPIRAIVSASAPLGTDLAEAAERRWQTEVLEIFGATEVGSIASRRTVTSDAWHLYPGLTLTTEGDGVYLRDGDGPAEPLHDVVEPVDREHFRLLDRRSDLVKIGGRRASLAALNRALTGIAGVEDGVFLVPDEQEAGPTPRMRAFVVAPEREAAPIMAALRRQIDPAFLPRELVFVDRLPRNEMGKLPRAALGRLRPSETPPAKREAGRFQIPPDHPCLAGHFPGRPVVPGVVLLDETFALIRSTLGRAGRVGRVAQVKFLAPVLPGQTVDVTVEELRGNDGAVTLSFAAEMQGAAVLRGTAALT